MARARIFPRFISRARPGGQTYLGDVLTTNLVTTITLGGFFLLAGALGTACGRRAEAGRDGGPTHHDTRAAACTSFTGGTQSAVWTGCPDKIKREVACEFFVRDLKCDCYEDSVQTTFFSAKDPDLTSRESATRIANRNCRWSLETP